MVKNASKNEFFTRQIYDIFLEKTILCNFFLFYWHCNDNSAEFFVAFQVVGERFFADTDAFLTARCVEQMRCAVAFRGNANMSTVQPIDGGSDGDDGAFGNLRSDAGHAIFRNKIVCAAVDLRLYLANGSQLRRVAERRISIGVAAHKIGVFVAHDAAQAACDVGECDFLCVVVEPIGGVMQPRGVTIDCAIAVANVLQFARKFVVIFRIAAPESERRFDECNAVERIEANFELFHAVAVECASHVWRADELLRYLCQIGVGGALHTTYRKNGVIVRRCCRNREKQQADENYESIFTHERSANNFQIFKSSNEK